MVDELINVPRYPVITIDGPSGSGKGTVCLRLASVLNYQLLDSGALYRIVGLQAHQAGLLDSPLIDAHNNVLDEDAIAKLTSSLDIQFLPKQNKVSIEVNGIEIGQQIRNETVGRYASQVATLPKVRAALLDLQRSMAHHSGLVADGRDMGTVVFPNADAKIFLTASASARAQRRLSQLKQSGEIAAYEQILKVIQERDERDENRAVAPSKPATDALVIDSSNLSADAVYEQILRHCQGCGISN